MPKLSSAKDHPKLHAFLKRAEVQEAGLTAAYFDGFATGAAVGPPMRGIQGFMDLMLGDDPPPFEGEDEVRAVMSTVFERYNELAGLFDTDPTQFEADFRKEDVEDWATGFGRAMSLNIDAWEELAADQNYATMLMLVLGFARGETTGKPMVEEFEDADADGRAETASYIPTVVPMIALYFRHPAALDEALQEARDGEAEGAPQPPPVNANEPRRNKKVGRNEPCPCGSGKKYKKCCGAQ